MDVNESELDLILLLLDLAKEMVIDDPSLLDYDWTVEEITKLESKVKRWQHQLNQKIQE
jgi:hypothetical protein